MMLELHIDVRMELKVVLSRLYHPNNNEDQMMFELHMDLEGRPLEVVDILVILVVVFEDHVSA
jgi:hypothetical protein